MRAFFRFCFMFSLVFLGFQSRFIFAQVSEEETKGQEQITQQSTALNVGGASQETGAQAGAPAFESPVNSVLQINQLGNTTEPLYSFELRDADIADLFRILAHDYKLNLLVDKDVQGKVTASLSNVSFEEAINTIAESLNLALKKKGKIIQISLNLLTKTVVLKYIEAKKILEPSGTSAASAAAASETNAGLASTIYDLLSDKGKILLGKQPNSIIIIDYPPNIEKVENYLKAIDQRMASRVFKLKYLKAADVVGETSTAAPTSSETAASSDTTETSSTTASTTSGGS